MGTSTEVSIQFGADACVNLIVAFLILGMVSRFMAVRYLEAGKHHELVRKYGPLIPLSSFRGRGRFYWVTSQLLLLLVVASTVACFFLAK